MPPPSVCLQSQASDALAPPGEEGELTSALRELSALMIGLAENPAMGSPGYRRLLLTQTLPVILKEVLSQTYAAEPANVVFLAQEALQSVARALAKVCVCVMFISPAMPTSNNVSRGKQRCIPTAGRS